MKFSNHEYADMVFYYGRANGNSREARRLYEEAFPQRRIPNRLIFQNTFARLQETGSVLRQSAGRNMHGIAEDEVLEAVSEDPSTSVRKISQEVGVSKSEVHRVIKYNKIHPYHYTPVQSLHVGDCQRRLQFCTLILEKDRNDSNFLKHILWTDESNFNREGITNYHNLHYYSQANPHMKFQSKHQIRFSVNVWAGIIGKNCFFFT